MDSYIDAHMISCRVVITHPHPPIVTIIISLLLLLLLSTLPPSLSQQPPPSNHSLCSRPYKCGDQPALYYPFSGGDRPLFCGGGGDQYNLTCNGGHSSIQMGSQKFWVWEINTMAYTMRVEPVPEGPDVCSTSPPFNFSLSPLFRYNQTVHDITIVYGCPSAVRLSGWNNFTCDDSGDRQDVYYYEGTEDEVLKQHPDLDKCGRRIQVPAEAVHQLNNGGDGGLNGTFGEGFNVSYTVSQECIRCLGSRGACGSHDTTHEFTCYCQDGSNHRDCSVHGGSRGAKLGIGVGVGAVVLVALTVIVAFYDYQHRKKTRDGVSYIQSQSMSSILNSQNI